MTGGGAAAGLFAGGVSAQALSTVAINKKPLRDSYPIIILRRMLTLDEQRRVIWLGFGSLKSMERRWHTAAEVKEMTGVSYSN